MIALAYSRDGTRLAAAGTDRTVRIWDLGAEPAAVCCFLTRARGWPASRSVPTDKVLATGGGAPPAVIQTPTGKVPAAEDEGRTIRFWDPTTGGAIASFGGHVGSIHALAFSPDGTRLASAGADRNRPDLGPGHGKNAELSCRAIENAVFAVAFSPDGTRLGFAGADRRIRCWDVETGRLIHTLEGHTNWVMGVAFSPDGSRIASAGADQTVRIWDPARGREVLTLRGPRDRVHGVAFSPDGERLAGASADGIVRVWETESLDTP